MNIGIYKPGQGYWVRVLSAVFLGSLVLSGAMWGWSQAGAFTPPTPTWEVDLAAVRGEFTPGAQVNLLAPGDTA
ncbi:MAG TPA: hypothetical protein ENJ00_08230, partial [Phycisphaerales bacterium]|nr:hypothetical protein [Phycisphaerales bacterium]